MNDATDMAYGELRVGDERSANSSDAATRLSKLRHTVNNYLTTALAESQMVLMDLEPGETREGCERIDEQLRAIARAVKEAAGTP